MRENSVEITPELLAQNPWLALALTGMSVFIVAVLVGSLLSWTFLVIKARRGEPWLATEPQVPRVWGLADLTLVIVLVVGCQTLFASAYVRMADVDVQGLQGEGMPSAVTAVASLGNILAIGLTLGWLALRFQVSPSQVGFLGRNWNKQLQIAVITTLATLPIVYTLMAVVSIGLDTTYEHPLLDEIRSTATLGSYLLGVLTAVLLAPLAEEFLFRVMLQGWLQAWPVSSLQEILLGASAGERAAARLPEVITAEIVPGSGPISTSAQESPHAVYSSANPAEAVHATDKDISSAYSPANTRFVSNHLALAQLDQGTVDTLLARTPPIWPSIVTGILFGLAHWGYGLSFIPLIILGIVLGLVYRATNSIWPCFFIHLALNATSMLGLGLSILVERANVVACLWAV